MYILDCAPITLEDGVWVGANVTIATPCHPFLSDERLPQQYPDGFHDLEYAKPIHIGSGSWICSSATICGGVTIGKNCIVAAGAVVTRDVPDNCIVAGVPAKVLRKLDEQDRMQVWDTYMKNESSDVGEGKREKVIASVHKECYTDIYEVMKVWISQQQWQQSIISIW